MPRSPSGTSPSEPLPASQVVGRSTRHGSLDIGSSPSDSSPPSSASPAPAKRTVGGRPSLPEGGTASSPDLGAAAGDGDSSSGEEAGVGGQNSATSSSNNVGTHSTQASSDSFPALDDVKEALTAESAADAQSPTSAQQSDAAATAAAPRVAGESQTGYAEQETVGSGALSNGWSTLPPAASALGMTMAGLPLVPLSNGPVLHSVGGSGRRRTGSCKFFNAQKGFGFILDDDAAELGNDEVFVHYTAIAAVQGGPRGFRSLLEGEAVEYSVVQGPKGWQAQDVTGPNGAPCIGTPPGGVSKSSFPSNPGVGSSFVKGAGRRASDGSSAFTSPMRSTRESSLFGSSFTDETPRSSLGSPASRTLRLQTAGQGPAFSNGLASSPQSYQPPMSFPYGSPSQHQPPPLSFHYPDFPHPDGCQSPHGATFFGPPDDGTSPTSPIDPRFGPYPGPFMSMPPPPPSGMDPSGPPQPFYPISSSSPHAAIFPHPHTHSSYPVPASPLSPTGYPISSSPGSAPYPHLFPVPGPYPPYPGFMPGMFPAPTPGPPMYFEPSAQASHGYAPQPYPISSSAKPPPAAEDHAASSSPEGADGSPSGLAIGVTEGDTSVSNGGPGAQPTTAANGPVKVPAPLPGAARPEATPA